MRRKARVKKTSQGVVRHSASTCFITEEKTLLGGMKQPDNLSKNPAGRGLGKAGAKRLGRLLKRVIQPKEEPAGKGKATLPKTPVRLFKHQIETKANIAPKEKSTKQISKVILSVVSQCKHRGGISMTELKQTLAAEGYNVAKKNRQINTVTERLVNETLVRTTRNTSFKLNNKKVMETPTAEVNTEKSPKPTWKLRGKTAATKSPEGATRSQKKDRKTQKARDRTQKLKGSTGRAAVKSQKQRPARKSRENPRKPARKKPQLAKNRTIQVQRPPAKAKRTQRQPKQVKSSQRGQPQRRPKRLQMQHRQNTRRA
ncbi:histone H1.1-like [Girardinichthys multiradiatus]|uniref:histone H1.1-like n=1 Tax=Girardinichthys multiradiatus TaxID=208333 RepID=UPI001FACB7D8|nr:histone H1.1-like [Girardinichthys multiradiatus]